MKTIKTTFVLIVAITFLIACSSDDDTSEPLPTVTYNDITLNAVFFQEGNSASPAVNWNGNQGSFSLANTIEGLTINTTTGVLSWTKLLAPKTHEVEVIATNSTGQIAINITLNNSFQGTFTGGLNFNPSSTTLENYVGYTFNVDGSFVDTSGYDPAGTYTLTDTTITSVVHNGTIGWVYFAFELFHTATEVKLIGYWSTIFESPTQTTADGYIELTYTE